MARWKAAALGALLGLLWAGGLPVAGAETRRETAAHTRAHESRHAAAHTPRARGHHAAVHTPRARDRHAAAVRPGRVQEGKASIYAAGLRGRKMADGTPFDPASDSAASKTLPLGTAARVTNLENGRTATVRVRDRGPHRAGRVMDVSPGTAGALGMKRDGVAPVAVVPLASPPAAAGE